MKKSELRHIIREELKNIIEEKWDHESLDEKQLEKLAQVFMKEILKIGENKNLLWKFLTDKKINPSNILEFEEAVGKALVKNSNWGEK